ncbi:MAG TPA: glycosyltransferase [Rhizomicrobium sp.]|jgi:glycosyltransferase involved in cell wall biosynthesis|nr:glycosyltransferase [Rhizomicrobium sp.]
MKQNRDHEICIGKPAGAASWLSVVMPTWCGERWIGAALESITAEEASGVEVLVLDSSPTPATVDIARGYAGRLNLHIVSRPDLPTWQAKTNLGVAMAAADHVCWLHQDDLWLPGRTGAVRSWIAAAPNATLHLAPSTIIDRNGRTLGLWRCPLPVGRKLDSTFVIRRLLVQNFIAAPAPVFRKQAWLDCGGMDEQLWYTGDWDVWLKLAATGPVIYHDQVTTSFRIHPDSQTITGSRDLPDFALQMRTVLERHLPRLGEDRNTDRVARASIAINTALAASAAGRASAFLRPVTELLGLGPAGVCRYLRDSRIVERVTPRVRASLRGSF